MNRPGTTEASPHRSDDEHLLWELSSEIDEKGGASLADDVLMAYREGRLGDDEAPGVEKILAHNPAARRRLAELSRVPLAGPSAAARERYLFALPRPRARAVKVWWRTAAAAAAAVALASGYWLAAPRGVPFPGGLPADLAYDLAVSALAENRSQEPGSTWTAFPDTPLEITALPREDAVAGLAFGLYVERQGRIEKLDVPVEIHRGTATFETFAASRLSSEPGIHSLYVVIAAAGHLPDERRLAAGEDAATALADELYRRIERLDVTLLDPPRDPR